VLQFFPFVGLVAVATSIVMLVQLAAAGELRLRGGAIVVAVCLLAGYWQFFSDSPLVAASGLTLQTLLAVSLIAWWRYTA